MSSAPLRGLPHSTGAAQDEADVALFKEFLRINTMHPKPDFVACDAWLRRVAAELGMQYRVVECVAGLPNIVLTLPGADRDLPSLLLNCHLDVVPVVPSMWTALPAGETPFSAWEDPSNGFIYARGAQDMKCVGAQYICAIRALKAQHDAQQQSQQEQPFRFRRTVHLLFVPDEEIGGPNGMGKLVRTRDFAELNVGLALDEGLAHDENRFVIYYGERTPLWVTFLAKGPVGHAAKLVDSTAMDRLARVVERMTKRRDANVAKLAQMPSGDLGECTSVNWTFANAGVQTGPDTYAYNVIPREGRVTFDVRVALPDFEAITAEWRQWAEELNLELRFEANIDPTTPSPYSPTNSAWFNVLKATLAGFGAEVSCRVFPAATDSRYIRRAGVPAYGFSPMRNVPSLLHDHNEYLPRATYLEGVAVYRAVIPALANTAGDLTATSRL